MIKGKLFGFLMHLSKPLHFKFFRLPLMDDNRGSDE